MVKKEFLDNKSNVLHFVDTVIIKCTVLKLEIQVYLISSGSFWRSNLKMMRIKKKCILKIIYKVNRLNVLDLLIITTTDLNQ